MLKISLFDIFKALYFSTVDMEHQNNTQGFKEKIIQVTFILIPQLNLESYACLNTEFLRRKGLKYASIPVPSLLEIQNLFVA